MCLTPAAAAAPSAARPARVAHAHGDAEARRRLVDLAQEAREVAGEVLERAAGRHDVDEAEQRGLELGVLGGQIHGLVVERAERVALRGHRGREAGPDVAQLRLEEGLLHHGRHSRRPRLARWPL